ncbi:SDR family oxidoreductase [Cupriavidus basilensis]
MAPRNWRSAPTRAANPGQWWHADLHRQRRRAAALPGTAAYGAAKAGILNAVRSLAVEWALRVRVTAVSPGLVLTETAQQQHYGDAATLQRVADTVPLGRSPLRATSPTPACSWPRRMLRMSRRQPGHRRRRRASGLPRRGSPSRRPTCPARAYSTLAGCACTGPPSTER